MVPVGDVAAAADMRHHQMLRGIVRISVPQFLDGPAAEFDRMAFHVLVPDERAVVFAARVVREIRPRVAEEHDVVVAARGRAAAPFLHRIDDEAAGLVEALDRIDAELPVLVGDLEIVRRVAEHVDAADVARIARVVFGAVGADRVVRMDVQVRIQRARRRQRRVDREPRFGRAHVGPRGHVGHDAQRARIGREVVERAAREPRVGQRVLAPVDGFAARVVRGHAYRAADVAARIAPAVLQRQPERRARARLHEARAVQQHVGRRAGADVDRYVAGHRDEARRAERIDVEPEAEVVLGEGLHARAGAAAAVAEADHDPVARIDVAVDDIDDHGFLERPLVPLLVEAHVQRLHRGRALAGHERRGVVFGADVVGRARIARLEQRPVRIELEGGLQPAAVGDAGRADLVIEHDLAPFAGFDARDIALHAPGERQALVAFVQACGCYVRAEAVAQRGGAGINGIEDVFGFVHLECKMMSMESGVLQCANGQGALASQTGTPMYAYHGAITQRP
ncbi:hypothetical protein EMIT0111MI5_70024 [Burkholderia sp. IT-111MI5]